MPVTKPSPFKHLLLAAFILRLFLSAFFFHPDIKKINYQVQFLKSGVVDVYRHISSHALELPNDDTFNYPPLTYYSLGLWETVSSKVLGPELDDWLNDWGSDVYTHPRLPEFMLILKLPFLIMDFIIGWYLIKNHFQTTKSQFFALTVWFFNPLSLYAIYMLSSFDLLPVLLTVLAWNSSKLRNLGRASLYLGLGTAIKSYPLLLFPFVLMRARRPRDLISALSMFFIGLFISILPVISSPEFRYTMTHSNLMQRIFEAGIDVGGNQNLPIYVVIYILAIWFSWNRRHISDLLPEFLTVTLSVLLISHFHAQWTLWSLPFLVLLLTRRPNLWPVMSVIIATIFIVNILLTDQYVFLGLFNTINPSAILFPPLPEMIKSTVDPILLQSLAHTILAGSGAWVIYDAWKNYATK